MDQLSNTVYNLQLAWTAGEKVEAIKLYNEGWTMLEIGIRFHKSRSAVAGLIHRERKKKGNTVEAHRGHINHTKRNHTETGEPTPVELLRESLSLPPDLKVTVKRKKRVRLKLIDDVQQVTLLELKSHHCRFPIGDPRNSDFRFCGRPRHGRGPYCETHKRLAGRLYERATQDQARLSPSTPA